MPAGRDRRARDELHGDRRDEEKWRNANLGHRRRGGAEVRDEKRSLVKEYPRKQQPAYHQGSIVKHGALCAAYCVHWICSHVVTEKKEGAIDPIAPSGVDLTFATHPAASSSSECQIQNSTRNLY